MADNAHFLRFLSVDGNVDRQDAYRRAIAEIPGDAFKLLAAESGSKGLSLTRTFMPDCLVIADMLSDMGGASAA